MIDVSRSGHYIGDCRELLKQLPDACAQTCITSPPYWGLRDYGHEGQIGLEETPDAYVAALVEVFRGVRRALRDDGTLWLNLGDAYAGSWGAQSRGDDPASSTLQGASMISARQITEHPKRSRTGSLKRTPGLKNKDLIGLPWMLAFALRDDGWWLRMDVIWSKPNGMPESVRDRPTKAHEYMFVLSKSENYFYDADAIAEPLSSDPKRWGRHAKKDPGDAAVRARPMFGDERGGRDGTEWGNSKTRNKRSVWTVATQPYDGAHFATFPPDLIDPCVLAGSRANDLVLDPFFGSGTTGAVAEKHGRRWIGFDLGYEDLAKQRTAQRSLPIGTP